MKRVKVNFEFDVEVPDEYTPLQAQRLALKKAIQKIKSENELIELEQL